MRVADAPRGAPVLAAAPDGRLTLEVLQELFGVRRGGAHDEAQVEAQIGGLGLQPDVVVHVVVRPAACQGLLLVDLVHVVHVLHQGPLPERLVGLAQAAEHHVVEPQALHQGGVEQVLHDGCGPLALGGTQIVGVEELLLRQEHRLAHEPVPRLETDVLLVAREDLHHLFGFADAVDVHLHGHGRALPLPELQRPAGLLDHQP
mmetsp:Transcript_74082/g.130753  ORF Transcript_74082/g.130753 Transcript_74082/m.130753 type:complete len:203 (-) Transcript_74082:1639-2247(-)